MFFSLISEPLQASAPLRAADSNPWGHSEVLGSTQLVVLDSALGFVGFTYIRRPQKEEEGHSLTREQCFTFIPSCT